MPFTLQAQFEKLFPTRCTSRFLFLFISYFAYVTCISEAFPQLSRFLFFSPLSSSFCEVILVSWNFLLNSGFSTFPFVIDGFVRNSCLNDILSLDPLVFYLLVLHAFRVKREKKKVKTREMTVK